MNVDEIATLVGVASNTVVVLLGGGYAFGRLKGRLDALKDAFEEHLEDHRAFHDRK